MTIAEPSAVLFDVDGTLVDSNYLHVHAWVRAFHDVGRAVHGVADPSLHRDGLGSVDGRAAGRRRRRRWATRRASSTGGALRRDHSVAARRYRARAI